MSLLAVGFGCYGGFLLKPLGQLHEAVIWRLPVMMRASAVVRRGLLHELATFGVRLCWAAAVVFIIMHVHFGFASSLFGELLGLLDRQSSCWSCSGPSLRFWRANVDTFPSVDRAGREDCGNHGAQTLPGPRCYDRLGDGIGNLDPSGSLSSKFIRLFFGFGFGLRKQKKRRKKPQLHLWRKVSQNWKF